MKNKGKIEAWDIHEHRTKLVEQNAQRLGINIIETKVKDASLMVVEDFGFDVPNTKNFINVLKALGLENKKSLLVLGESNKNVYLSSRNLQRASVVTSSELSTYGIMNNNALVLTEGSIEGIVDNLSK